MLGHLFAKGGWAAALLLAVALSLWALSVRQSEVGDALADHGAAATATLVERREVVGLATDRSGRQALSRSQYRVTYEFVATQASGARSVERFSESVSPEAYAAAKVGDTVAVRYLPEDPSRFERADGATATEAWALRWIAIGAAHLAFLILAFAWRPALRATLRSRARLRATATVEGIWGDRADVAVRVRFTDEDGVVRRAVLPSVLLSEPGALKVGTELEVLYDPRDPHSVMLG